MTRVCAIESSCDDTSVAIVHDAWWIYKIEQMFSYSQVADHQQSQGVVPELAYRLHSDRIIPLIDQITLDKIWSCDAIAVTTHPWLPWSLMVGITVAQTLSQFLSLPFVAVDHIDGHIASLLIDRHLWDVILPAVILSASGWHTSLFHVTDFPQDGAHSLGPRWIKTLGVTLDDASGECFDKVSTMLGGWYPGGPWIDIQARLGKSNPLVSYRPILLHKWSLDFSFSGMKSQTYQLLQRFSKYWVRIDSQLICDIAYAFQETMVEILIKKISLALEQTSAKSIGIVGWVSANTRLQDAIWQITARWISYLAPVKMNYCVDNAGMIWVAGLLYYMYYQSWY